MTIGILQWVTPGARPTAGGWGPLCWKPVPMLFLALLEIPLPELSPWTREGASPIFIRSLVKLCLGVAELRRMLGPHNFLEVTFSQEEKEKWLSI